MPSINIDGRLSDILYQSHLDENIDTLGETVIIKESVIDCVLFRLGQRLEELEPQDLLYYSQKNQSLSSQGATHVQWSIEDTVVTVCEDQLVERVVNIVPNAKTVDSSAIEIGI